MLFFPYSTDAPIYHLPIATGTIIVVNVLVFFFTTVQVMLGNLEEESVQWLILEFNQINPLQWITGSFMHAGILHLLGNMFFLWAFGLVIEGKIGSLRFLVLYLVISLIDGAAVQIPMYFLSGESGALGASGVIFALMTIAVIWAPENEMDCVYWILFLPGTVEVRIIALGIAFLFLQLVFLFLGGFSMSSEMLHTVGAFIGAPIGFLMLRQGWVDCEGWDVVSRSFLKDVPIFSSDKQRRQREEESDAIDDPVAAALARTDDVAKPGRSLSARESHVATALPGTDDPTAANALKRLSKKKNPKGAVAPADASKSPVATPTHPEWNRLSFVLRQALESRNLVAAMQTFHQLDHLNLASALSDRTLFQYAAMLGQAKRPTDMLRPLGLVASRNDSLANDARIRMAMIQIRVLKNPQLALRSLHEITEAGGTSSDLLRRRDEMISLATRMVDS